MPSKPLLQAGTVPDVKATISITLEDVHRVCHGSMYKSPVQWTGLFILAGATGIEPATSGVTGRRSNRLNYAPDYFIQNLLLRTLEHKTSNLPERSRDALTG